MADQLVSSAADVRQRTLSCLATLFRFHGIAMGAEALGRELPSSEAIGADDIVRLARRQDLKARRSTTSYERLAAAPLPALAGAKDGSFFILGRSNEDKVLVHRGTGGAAEVLDRNAFEAVWDGSLIYITRRATLSDFGRQFDISWFMRAIYKYRNLLSQVLLASFFLQIFALVTPLFFQVVVDKVLVHRGMTTLDVLLIGLVTVSIFETVLGALRTYVFSHTTNRIDVELGARLFRHLVALPLAYFGARRVGDSVARVRELENIRQFITGSSLTLVIDLFFTIVFLAVMAWYSWWLTFIVLASLPLYAGISLALTPLFRARVEEKFQRGAENQAFLVETVTGIETLKSMAVEPQMQRRWEEQLAGYVGSSFRVANLGNYASQSIQLVSKLATAGILYFGAKAVISGDMTVGALVAFNMLASRVSQPVLRLAQVWQDFHQVRQSIQRLGDILNTPPEPAATPGRGALPTIKGAIRFDHVKFRYRLDGPEVLCGVNIEFPAGQVVGIVGSSGSGKSTVAKLVQRLYVPESGRVLVDGIDLAMVDASWLRRQIGVVLQENVLFNRTVRENIALADPGMPLDQVVAAAKLAGAHDFILQLPEGYDTVIGERGGTLSGGQRQRIAIARALVTNPRILIFDEATSALDLESEQAIQRNMRHICKGRTVLIIAHRLSTVRTCDRIITIEQGRIVEDGKHEDLIRSGGRYALLHRVQTGEVIDAA
ncbi:type I secretion system permease/ATPase [Dongia deserti]|uniref:type I secretion system permease/ATPase n=1 Tax=Dongia deserti TaxID=2268030 RepID=UPI000E65D4FD|nr:type I secretion system permease/ATPase [Dongia deserti]